MVMPSKHFLRARSTTLGADEYVYAFDNIGNRMTSAENGTDRNYAANQLNQYTAISNPTFNPSYDDDGNELTVRTGTGAWVIEYNAENRGFTISVWMDTKALNILHVHPSGMFRLSVSFQTIFPPDDLYGFPLASGKSNWTNQWS